MTAQGYDSAAAQWPPPGRADLVARGLRRRSVVPHGLAQFMRPMMAVLTAEIVDEIQRRIADYSARTETGVYQTSTRLAIVQSVEYFVEHVADPTAPRTTLDETLQRIGRGEAYEGRSLDALREAFQIGAGLAWRRIHSLAAKQGLPAQVLGDLGDELFDFIASLSEQAAIGHHVARAQLSDAAHRWRERVLELILAGPAAPAGELAAHAGEGNWRIPETVCLVAIRVTPGAELPPTRMLHPRSLARLHADEPVVLLPTPMDPEIRTEVALLFAGHRIAFGCEVPLAEAATSLRWARRALQLADDGTIPATAVIDCRDHVGALWIHAEPLLADLVVRSTLAPLFAEPPNSRRILGETLLLWITTTRPTAPALAEILGKHPQTVRYRLKRLREIFGDTLDDADALLEMFFALRATGHLWNEGAAAPRGPKASTLADIVGG